ncbi:hypothetical protein EDD18DRAFT_1108451 [Armillaria luteobubalina]|uniref:Uncharacterized protein n=1 Tax=Armillaria luteobubalina TaxID=153913 RepID=A0AA39PZ56_9AGAR|nr:hypothetical protein EDD18DRAFT_1108451 [Armillaria luteobubalina]
MSFRAKSHCHLHYAHHADVEHSNNLAVFKLVRSSVRVSNLKYSFPTTTISGAQRPAIYVHLDKDDTAVLARCVYIDLKGIFSPWWLCCEVDLILVKRFNAFQDRRISMIPGHAYLHLIVWFLEYTPIVQPRHHHEDHSDIFGGDDLNTRRQEGVAIAALLVVPLQMKCSTLHITVPLMEEPMKKYGRGTSRTSTSYSHTAGTVPYTFRDSGNNATPDITPRPHPTAASPQFSLKPPFTAANVSDNE